MERIASGILLLYFLHAVLLTVPVSLILIWRYRLAVASSMALSDQGDPFPAAFDAATPPIVDSRPHVRQPSGGALQRRLVLVYLSPHSRRLHSGPLYGFNPEISNSRHSAPL